MLDRMLSAAPLSVSGNEARDGAFYADSATILDEQAEEFVPLPEHENLDANMYPILGTGAVDQYDTSRDYTDRVKLRGYFPRVNSSHYVLLKSRRTSETVMLTIRDVETNSSKTVTTLLCQRKGLDD